MLPALSPLSSSFVPSPGLCFPSGHPSRVETGTFVVGVCRMLWGVDALSSPQE